MPALTEVGKYKRLAELFVLAMKVDPVISAKRNNEAIACLMEHGLTDKQAESFLDAAFKQLDRGMLRPLDQTLKDIATSFRMREHGILLAQLQAILEAGEISADVQKFFDECCGSLFHGA